jgi:hypothetical protein
MLFLKQKQMSPTSTHPFNFWEKCLAIPILNAELIVRFFFMEYS